MNIVIECLHMNGGPYSVFCKGNVSDDDFIEAVRDYDKRELEDNVGVIEPYMICHATVRCIPFKESDGYYGVRFVQSGPGRGAFDITYVDYDGLVEFV